MNHYEHLPYSARLIMDRLNAKVGDIGRPSTKAIDRATLIAQTAARKVWQEGVVRRPGTYAEQYTSWGKE